MSIFAERIKGLRKKRGCAQDEIGRLEPDFTAASMLAKCFDVSTDYIIGITGNMKALTNRRQKPLESGLFTYEKYLMDDEFIPYLNLAVEIKDNNVELSEVKKFVNDLIKQCCKK